MAKAPRNRGFRIFLRQSSSGTIPLHPDPFSATLAQETHSLKLETTMGPPEIPSDTAFRTNSQPLHSSTINSTSRFTCSTGLKILV